MSKDNQDLRKKGTEETNQGGISDKSGDKQIKINEEGEEKRIEEINMVKEYLMRAIHYASEYKKYIIKEADEYRDKDGVERLKEEASDLLNRCKNLFITITEKLDKIKDQEIKDVMNKMISDINKLFEEVEITAKTKIAEIEKNIKIEKEWQEKQKK